MAKRYKNGRKKQPTTVAGRLMQAWDYGNDRVRMLRASFEHPKLHGGKAAAEAHDPIGMLYATLWLEDHGHDSKEMVRIAREYAFLFYERFARGGGCTLEPSHTPRDGGRPPEGHQSDGQSARYCRLDEALGFGAERKAVRDLMLGYYGSDEVPAWVQHFINERRRLLGMSVAGWLPTPQDQETLASLVRGLCRLVDGALPARFERKAA